MTVSEYNDTQIDSILKFNHKEGFVVTQTNLGSNSHLPCAQYCKTKGEADILYMSGLDY